MIITTRHKVAFERKCAELVCPDCGGHHTVMLDVRAEGSMAVPRVLSGKRCDGYSRLVVNLLKTETERWINSPFSNPI